MTAGAARIILRLSCIDKRPFTVARIRTVHSERGGKGPIPLKKPKKSSKGENCQRFHLQEAYRVCLIFATTGVSGLGTVAKELLFRFWQACATVRVCQFITGKSSITRDSLEA